MIGLGLRGLVGAGGKILDAGRKAGSWMAQNPVKTALGATAAAAMIPGEPSFEDRMSDYEATPAGQYGKLFYSRHETHRPSEAYDAYAEDDFIKTAFSSAKNYEQFSQILKHAGLNAKEVFPEDLYEQIVKDPKLAAEFAKDRIANHMADLEKDQKGFGEGWREKWKQDQWQQERARKYAMALQQMGA